MSRYTDNAGRRAVAALLGWLVVLALLSGLGALLAVGANGPPDPRLAPAEASAPVGAPVEFGEIAFRVTPRPGSGLSATSEGCALLAETERQHQKGLMGRRDLGGYDAMVFRFAADQSGSFFMRNVPIPLSIAWFDARGRLVSTAEMEPCPDQEGCPQYAPAGPYRFALEVERGGLGRLGIDDDSVLSVGGDCSPR
ncbi:MAG: hypothetical protein CYG61_01210 [Actinobacteria bacterium]|nr:MAG: hypothetical protein CYG61_01210 [Actinomycetota bacterium]